LAADAGPNQSVNAGQSIQISGSPTASGGTAPYSYSWSPNDGSLDDASAETPNASPASTTTYTVTVTDANGCTATDAVTVEVIPVKAFVFVANKVTINKDNTINGTPSVGPVDNEPLPSLNYSAGGSNAAVPSGGSLAAAPGSCNIVTLNSGGTLQLTSGEYFMNELRYSGSEAVIEIDLSSGAPVKINVVNKLQLGKEAAIQLLPNGESDSKLVTFNTLQNSAVSIGKEAYLLGSFNAPNANLTLVKNSQLLHVAGSGRGELGDLQHERAVGEEARGGQNECGSSQLHLVVVKLCFCCPARCGLSSRSMVDAEIVANKLLTASVSVSG